MPDQAPPRPRGVTVAGVTAVASCVLVVGVLVGANGSLRSSENQDAIREFLSTPPGSSLGMGVGQVLDLLHVVVLVSGALAAAGAVLAAYTLRRHRGARVGLSVVAVAMVVTTTFVAGLLPFVVALSAAMLWRREARDWFDGRAPRAVPAPPPSLLEQPPPMPPSSPSPHPSAPSLPGRPPAAYAAAPAPAVRRPAAVVAAACTTWVFAGLTLLVLALVVLLLLTEPGPLLDSLQDSPRIARLGYTREELFAGLWVVVAVGAAWQLAAIALAVLAFRGVRAGQVGLVVSAAASALVGIATVVVPVAAVATIVLLLGPSSNRWFSGP